MQARQGDVFVSTARLPEGVKRVAPDRGRLVLARGEATDHVHAVDPALAELFEARDGALYLCVSDAGAAITHEEHAAVALTAGTYRVTRQREYSPEAIRSVAD